MLHRTGYAVTTWSERAAAHAPLITLLLSAALVATPATARAKITVHDYSYNVDGALTAITTQVNEQPSTTTYLTWDDFTPDATTPTTGTVAAGDGRLVGFGPSPGTGNLTARFTFDPRDRLLGYSGDAGDETYAYHANGEMMSSSAGGDDLRFYLDGGTNAVVTNIHQDSTGLTSAYLGNNRFLADGTEQILLKPRKDMACTYDAASQTLQSYAYDAFGAPPERDKPKGTYDLRDNPFRYAGEYRDPIWGGYYLRARWYDPDLPVFLSRDPAQHLNRYAYGNGNPVMNEDPSGYGPGGLRGFLARLNRGVGGHVARIFLAPLLGPLQIVAYPKQFWQSVKTDRGGIDVFLALGIASEVGGGIADFVYAGFARLSLRYSLRLYSDTVIGVGSSIGAGASRGFGHFDWNAFGQGLEYTANPILMRGFTGFNVRTGFRLSGAKVGDLFEQLRNAPDETALVFRQRLGTGSSTSNPLRSSESSTSGALGANVGFDKPFTQAAHLSFYHEKLIAITKNDLFTNEAFGKGVVASLDHFDSFNDIKAELVRISLRGKLELVGRVEQFDRDARWKFLANPHNVPEAGPDFGQPLLVKRGAAPSTYSWWQNNCQHHAYAVLQGMGLR